jgi:zinc/manganese transport system substrate-binding protein
MSCHRQIERALLTLALAALLSGWSTPARAALKVFACEPEWAALAQEIGGDAVSVFSATTALQDPHQVQARPSLIARLRNADLLVCTGADQEIGWLPILLLQSANGKVQPGAPGYLLAADHVQLLEVPVRLDRALGDLHAQGNPHIQSAARNIAQVIVPLQERLALLDPERAGQYQARGADFRKRWQAAVARWEARAAPLKGVPVLTHHKGWIYLINWLGLEEIGVLEPKPGVPPSTAHLNSLLAQLKLKPAKLVIRAPYDAPQASEFISARLGIPSVVLPYTVGGSERARDLFGLFDETIDLLLRAAK